MRSATTSPGGPPPSESDTNQSVERRAWAARNLDQAARALLAEDERHFLRQSVSTPCLNAIVKAEGIFIEDTVGRKRKGAIRNAARTPAIDLAARAALLGRVGCLEPLGHGTKGLARKSVLERATRPIDQEDIVAFLDARRGQEEVRGEDQGGQESGAGPAPGAMPDRSGENHEHAGRQKGEDVGIVDRKSERDEDKDQHRELRQDALRVRALHDRRGM